MKRSDFLAIISIFPFIRKKETVESIAAKYNVPACKIQAFEHSTFENRIEEYKKIWFNADFKVKGEDLIMVIKNKNDRKG